MAKVFSRLALLLLVFAFTLTAPASTQAQGPTAISYNLGEATIIQDQFSPDARFHNMPVTLQGVLAVPAGEGPFPVALFVHGSYPFCNAPETEINAYPCPPENDLRQYEGFSYLAEALAARGYLALVPDLSAEYNNGFGEPMFGQRAMQIVTAHLDALTDGEGFGVDVTGLADLSQLVIVSHSRGGSLAALYVAADSPATYAAAALALLTPAYMEIPAGLIPDDLPVALVISECDGDVGTVQPLLFWEEQLPSLRTALTMIYTLPAGTHTAFSTQLDPDRAAACADVTLLNPAQQRDFTAQFLPDFFDIALDYRSIQHAAVR